MTDTPKNEARGEGMSKGEPIFPIQGGGAVAIGLTKREYFAAMALQGMLANSYHQDFLNQTPLSLASKNQIASLAVDQANSLIEALEADDTDKP